MTMKKSQHDEVYQEITESGKSLLQLYVEMKEERDVAIATLAATKLTQNTSSVWEDNDRRMDIIGQNGNDGLHYGSK